MIILRNIFIILLTVLLFNCSEYTEDTEALKVNADALKSQSRAADSVVGIGPVNAAKQAIISLRTDNLTINGGEINWYINDSRHDSSKGIRFTSSELNKGDIVQAVIVKGERKFRSNKIIIKNTPPTIRKARLLPAIPRVDSTLTVNINTNDVDNDNISFKYEWTLNGKFAGEEDLLDIELKRGDMITVQVTPFDGEDYGKSIKLSSRIFNSLPEVSEGTPAFDGKIFKYHLLANDPDGDTLTYSIKEGPDGMTIDPASGIITWEVDSGNEDIHDIKVSVSDNNGGEIIVPFSTRINFAGKN